MSSAAARRGPRQDGVEHRARMSRCASGGRAARPSRSARSRERPGEGGEGTKGAVTSEPERASREKPGTSSAASSRRSRPDKQHACGEIGARPRAGERDGDRCRRSSQRQRRLTTGIAENQTVLPARAANRHPFRAAVQSEPTRPRPLSADNAEAAPRGRPTEAAGPRARRTGRKRCSGTARRSGRRRRAERKEDARGIEWAPRIRNRHRTGAGPPQCRRRTRLDGGVERDERVAGRHDVGEDAERRGDKEREIARPDAGRRPRRSSPQRIRRARAIERRATLCSRPYPRERDRVSATPRRPKRSIRRRSCAA